MSRRATGGTLGRKTDDGWTHANGSLANLALAPYALLTEAARGVFTATVARAKGRSSRWWARMGLLFGTIALLALPDRADA